MSRKDLVKLLEELAAKDLSEGDDIYDHPCSVVVRELNKMVDDFDFLRGVIKGYNNPRCKRAITLIN